MMPAITLPGLEIPYDTALGLVRWKLGHNPIDGSAITNGDFQFVPYEAYDGLADPAPNEVRLEDLYATTAMDSGAGSKAAWALARYLRDDQQSNRLSELLRALSPNATPGDEGVEQSASELLQALLNLDGFGPAVSCKLLCRKRPSLFPMWDSRVWDYVFAARREEGDRWPRGTGAAYYWNGFRWLHARVVANEPSLRSLADQVSTEVAGFQPSGPPITMLRALEMIIWLARSFPRRNPTWLGWWTAEMWPEPYWQPPGRQYDDFGLGWRAFCAANFRRADTGGNGRVADSAPLDEPPDTNEEG